MHASIDTRLTAAIGTAGPGRRTLPAFQFLAALALASPLLLTACGGGSSDVGSDSGGEMLRTTSSPQAIEPATVRLEGCVVDAQWRGAEGTAVHVRTAQGGSIGTTFSGARGVFEMQVPARAALVVDTSPAGGSGMTLNTGSSAVSLGGCLLADS